MAKKKTTEVKPKAEEAVVAPASEVTEATKSPQLAPNEQEVEINGKKYIQVKKDDGSTYLKGTL